MFSKASLFWWWAVKHKPWWITVASGILAALAFPPVPLAFLLLLAFVPLLSIAEAHFSDKKIALLPATDTTKIVKRPYLRFFLHTYTAFFIWNLGTCYWLMLTSLSVGSQSEAIQAFVAGFLAVSLNPVLQSLPWLLYLWARRRGNLIVALSLWVVGYLSFEFLHFNWDLTWSWVTLGHAFTLFPSYIQYIELTGVLGISFFVLVVNAFIFWGLRTLGVSQPVVIRNWGLALFTLLILPFGFKLILTPADRKALMPIGQKWVRVVQPNIDPYRKFDRNEKNSQLLDILHLCSEPLHAETTKQAAPNIIVLPETVFPASIYEENLTQDDQIMPLLIQAQAEKIDIIAGAVTYALFKGPAPASASLYDATQDLYHDSYNSAFIVGDTVVYKKGKLVPFTERTPFLENLGFLKGMVIDLGGGFGNFGLPDSIISLYLPHSHTKVAPIICYESEFGDYVRRVTNKGATFISILTNDGWFGHSSGHIQHAYFSVLRAIENRRWVVRSANTGMSLICTPQGKVTKTLGWWKKGHLDQQITLHNYQTFYMQYGDYMGYMAVISTVFLILRVGFRKKIIELVNSEGNQ